MRPWPRPMERADRIIVGGFAVMIAFRLAMWPLLPAWIASHPELLEAVQGSAASVINMGARARIGEASLVVAAFLAVPTLMMFDWLYWWAGRRWGHGVLLRVLGGASDRNERRLARLHRLEARFGPFAVVLAYFLPVPTALTYAAVGEGGMRLWVFLLLDAIGTALWTALLAVGGYALGRHAVDVADAVARYSLWVGIGGVLAFALWVGLRRARGRASARS